jgi:hypothetical protein
MSKYNKSGLFDVSQINITSALKLCVPTDLPQFEVTDNVVFKRCQ